MCNVAISLALFCTLLPKAMVVASQDSNCSYLLGESVLSCKHSPLTMSSLALKIKEQTVAIILNYVKHLHLQQDDLLPGKAARIRKLVISDCEDILVNPYGLEQFIGLKIVNIRDCDWYEILNDTFSGLLNLHTLVLTSNGITKLHQYSFRGVPNLEVLDLSYNSIAVIHSGVFAELSAVETLNLSENRIKLIECNNFEYLQNLQKLVLSYNSLKTIDADEFNKLKKLTELNLDNNNVRIIKGEFNLENLKFFTMGNNDLSNISAAVFKNCKSLMSIDIRGNNLTNLSEADFTGLTHLNYLNFHGNRVAESMFENLKKQTFILF